MSEDLENNKEYWVVFSGETELPLIKALLKDGYKHCFMIINDGFNWISFDPLAGCSDITVHHNLEVDFDYPSWMQQNGFEVIKACAACEINKPAPVGFYTCVEAVKRILGIHSLLVFTPWQLRNYLLNGELQLISFLKNLIKTKGVV